MIKNYNDLMYDSSPVKFNDYVTNKYNIIHKELYEEALKKLFIYLNIDINNVNNNYKIIEIKNTEFFLPSSVILISKTFPFNKETYDLTNYWPEYIFNKYNINDINYNIEKYNDLEIIYIDYIKGIVVMESRYNNVKLNVSFDLIDKDNIKIGESYSLKNLFSNKLKEL